MTSYKLKTALRERLGHLRARAPHRTLRFPLKPRAPRVRFELTTLRLTASQEGYTRFASFRESATSAGISRNAPALLRNRMALLRMQGGRRVGAAAQREP